MASKCLIKCLKNSHDPIMIHHQKKFILGRSKETKVKDKRCSRFQVELLADYESYNVKLTQIGLNCSGILNQPVNVGSSKILEDGETFELVLGDFPHRVHFEPPEKLTVKTCGKKNNELLSREETNGKRICDSDAHNVISMKKQKIDENSTVKVMEETSGWEEYEGGDLLIFNRKGVEGNTKIASFDMDGTLITTQSGLVFARNNDDWKIIFSEVPGKLKKLVKDGFKIVLFTNQAGIAAKKQTVAGIQKKISNILSRCGVLAQVLVSTGKKKYRKPSMGMWDFFVSECNDSVPIDMMESFYVGDAAGRPEISKQRKKDHSCADRLFALNLSLKFFTPEEFFLGSKPMKYSLPDFVSADIDCDASQYVTPDTKVPNHKLEIIVLVGFPASGKSTFAQKVLGKLGYLQVNRDTIGSWQKCVDVMQKAVKDNCKVVVDNTNPDRESRSRYTNLAKKLNIPIRCFVMNVSKDHARHNNKFRELTDSAHTKISDMIYNMYKSKFAEPKLDEGFDDIVRVNFIPNFKSKSDEILYKKFLLEK